MNLAMQSLGYPYPVVRTSQEGLVDGMHPYETLDPFTPSISLRVRNNRRQDTINSVDEIGGVPSGIVARRQLRLSQEPSRSSQSLDRTTGGQSRPSLESTRSLAPSSEQQGYNLPQARVPSSVPVPPTRRNALDTTTVLEQLTPVEGLVENAQTPVAHSPAGDGAQWRQGIQQDMGTRPTHGFSSQSLLTRPPRMWSFSFLSDRHPPQHPPVSELAQNSDFFWVGNDEEKNIPRLSSTTAPPEISLRIYVATFLTSILPRQIYLHCLLRLPYMYYSRVNQIFEDAHLTLEEIKEMALKDTVIGQSKGAVSPMPGAYLRLKANWQQFIDNLMREWKTLNIISGLLLSGILTIFQIDGAQTDSITRYMAFWSLLCALLSLLYGCFFIIRFSGMRRVYKATEWAIEAQRDQTIFWNVWVMLAMPAIWLVWSILAYIACIMAFMWRVRPSQPGVIIPPQIGPSTDAGFRIFICCVFGIGIIYAIFIINTLRRYGSRMDKMWTTRIAGFRRQYLSNLTPDELGTPVKSPPIRGVEVVPPTPPMAWTRTMSASPPNPNTVAVIPPKPSSPSQTQSKLQKVPYSPSSPSPLGRSPIVMTPVFSESRYRLSPDSELMQDPIRNFEEPGEPGLPPEGQALGLRFGDLGILDELSFPEAESNKQKITKDTVADIVMESRSPDSGFNGASVGIDSMEESGANLDTGPRLANEGENGFDESNRGR